MNRYVVTISRQIELSAEDATKAVDEAIETANTVPIDREAVDKVELLVPQPAKKVAVAPEQWGGDL